MDEATLRRLLAGVRAGGTSVEAAVRRLKGAPYERLGDMATVEAFGETRQVSLLLMPEAGQDSDFARPEGRPRRVRL